MLDRVRIVLVEPTGSANVGMTCRAMANMGLRDLVLVSPRCDLASPDALGYAAHGGELLRSARVVESVPAALAGCARTYATSSKWGLYRRQAIITAEAAANEAVTTVVGGSVAFAFGPERTGFITSDLLHFDRIVTIPADAAYPVLNLAAAVLIVGYELRRAALARDSQPLLPMALERPLATDEKKQVLFGHLFDALGRIGFFFGQSPEHLKYPLRHLFGRLDMTDIEADILIGMACQIRWYADHHRRPSEPAGASGESSSSETPPSSHQDDFTPGAET